MFTRRCSERRFFLRPDRVTTNTFWYCLGWAAQKHGLVLHAAVAMSNHVHIHATDPQGNYPNFLRDFLGLLARCMNCWRGRWEHFWDANQTSVVSLEDEGAQLDKLLYVLGNPIEIVGRAERWPGASSLASILYQRPIVASRPKHFFRDGDDGGSMPDTVTLSFEPAPAFAHLTRKEYVELIRSGIAQREAAAAQSGRKFLKPKAVLNQKWFSRPSDVEPRRALIPTVASRDRWRRFESLKRNRAFNDLYRRALQAFCSGVRDVVFPIGTWLMRFRAPILVEGQ